MDYEQLARQFIADTGKDGTINFTIAILQVMPPEIARKVIAAYAATLENRDIKSLMLAVSDTQL